MPPHTRPVKQRTTDTGSRATTPEVRARMQRQRRRDTKPEVNLRSLLHKRGLRFRVDISPMVSLRRRADIVFTRARVAIFVDGCFWHSCPLHGTVPKSNKEFWKDKLDTNRRRDQDTDARLAQAGWVSIHVWEHEDPSDRVEEIAAVIISRRITLSTTRGTLHTEFSSSLRPTT